MQSFMELWVIINLQTIAVIKSIAPPSDLRNQIADRQDIERMKGFMESKV